MKTDYLLVIQYEDDVTFKEKLDKATGLLSRYKIMRADAAQELFTDCGLQCGAYLDIVKDEQRKIKEEWKIPFPIFSNKNDSYRLT